MRRTPARIARDTLQVLAAIALLAPSSGAQNSSERIRPEPSAIAARAGSAVQWRESVDAAIEEAQRTGKPVFWYVPTISRSFMDRKDVVDRYMMAGPFSWPRTIELLNAHYIPIKSAASRQLSRRFELKPIEFIEPGYLILDGEGAVTARRDRITTFHPQRFLGPLASGVDVELDAHPFPGSIRADASAYESGRWTGVADWKHEDLEAEVADLEGAKAAETLYLRGVLLYHAAREEDAARVWRFMAEEHPDHPLTWKAAMEVEGHGPIVHGFEIYDALSEAALVPGDAGTRAPAGAYDAEDLWTEGVSYLRRMQRKSGAFDDSTYDFGGTDGLPNVFAAVTALAAQAMLEAQARTQEPDARTEEALQLARRFLSDPACINEWDRDERVWAHIYRIRLFARWLELRPADAEAVRPVLSGICKALVAMQDERGAWYHEYSNPFVTASCLIALYEASQRKVEIENLGTTVERGSSALLKCRAPNGAFTYGFSTGRAPRAQVEGGVGRIPLGELALNLWESKDAGDLGKAVALSFEHEDFLLPVQKYDDHTRNFAYGGFFFWYDLHARTEAIVALPAGPARDAAVKRQRELVLSLPEFDGCFIDSHEIGRSYGTAMGLICLALLDSI